MHLDLVLNVFNWIFAVEIFLRWVAAPNWQHFWRYYHILFFFYLEYSVRAKKERPSSLTFNLRNRADLIIAVATLFDSVATTHRSLLHNIIRLFAVMRLYRLVYLYPRVLRLLVSFYKVLNVNNNHQVGSMHSHFGRFSLKLWGMDRDSST